MIYRDSKAKHDTEDCPSPRGGEPCLNCGDYWECHFGWGCENEQSTSFSATSPNERYLTQSMLNSISQSMLNSISPSSEKKVNKTFTLSRECPCGIARVDCTYHRP